MNGALKSGIVADSGRCIFSFEILLMLEIPSLAAA
jgi:hypothetical protein